MLTRAHFGAYDPEVYKAQTYLARIGFDPGTIDGLWGPNTSGAAFDFRTWAGLPPATGVSRAEVMDGAFMAALWWAVNEEGLSTEVNPPSSLPSGGSGTSIVPTSPPTGTVRPGTSVSTAASTGLDVTSLLALGAVGLGALIVFGRRGSR